jgi:hypothetical protein
MKPRMQPIILKDEEYNLFLKPEDFYNGIYVSPDMTDEQLTKLVWRGYRFAERTDRSLIGNVRQYLEERREQARAAAQAASEEPEEEGNP